MLDIMRRRKGAIRIVLSFVVVGVAGSFALALYGVWGGALTQKEQGATNWIATVDGQELSTDQFQRRRALLQEDFRERFANQGIDPETLGAFVDQQALGATLGLFLAQRAAREEGLQVTPAEISETITSLPVLQRDGRFVGAEIYRRWLRAQGLDTVQFESEVAGELAADKIRLAVSGLGRVEESAVQKRYLDEIERVDLDYVLLADAAYADNRTPSESELRAWHASHASSYRTQEARRAAYVVFDREAKASSTTVSDADLKSYYDQNKASLFTHPEQRRASHILLRLAGGSTPEQEEALRAKASEILGRIRGGADFAEVARQSSEDTGSAAQGGDLGFFGRGRMVKEFEEAAFTLSPGSVSEVVKSPFGYHIIKVTDSRPAGLQPFEEVREDIRRTVSLQKAQEEVRKAADSFTTRLASQESSFDKLAAEAGLTVLDTGLFVKGEPAGALGRIPQADDAVFALAMDGTSPAVSVPQGLAVFALREIRPSEPAPFEKVRDRVAEDLGKSRARDKARGLANDLVSGSGDLKARAEKKKLEAKSYPAVNRIQPLPPLSEASKAAAFAAAPGSFLGPFEVEEGLLVIEVKAKTPATPDEAARAKEDLRRRMLDEDRSLLYQALMARLQKSAKIEVNQGALRTGRSSG